MMAGSFTKKIIQVDFTLHQGVFAGTDSNTVSLSGLRVECDVSKDGHPSKNKCRLKVYGMTESQMNQLTALAFKPLAVKNNLMRVSAGDAAGLSVVFEGTITGAWSVYRSPPNLYFHVEALTGYYPAIAPVPPTSFQGGGDVSTIMQGLATQMGYTFSNQGVTAQVSNPYLDGTAMQQASALADAAGCELIVDDGALVITPRGAPRAGTAPLLSAATGMAEYPVFDKKGIEVETLYNPAIVYGGLIVVESVVVAACGTWRVNKIKTHLESEKPNGKWESKVKASYVGN